MSGLLSSSRPDLVAVRSERMQTSPWDTYTPVWSAAVSNPTTGNASLSGAHRRLGTTAHLRLQLIIGTTSSGGSGALRLSMPSGWAAAGGTSFFQTGACFWFDNSTSQVKRGVAVIQGGNNFIEFAFADGDTRWATTNLAVSDIVSFTGTLELAP